MSKQQETRQNYWTSFYGKKSGGKQLMPPSQFAAFVASELEPGTAIFDVGCGNGRDSLFFATLGFKVISLDASKQAIKLIKKKRKKQDLDNLKPIASDVNGPKFQEAVKRLNGKGACIYARFFLHAINEKEQDKFLKTLAKSLHPGNLLAFEYRTLEDQALEKETPPHFRRYQSAKTLNTRLKKLGFKPVYLIEGQGFAKYKADDAIVARCIFEKT